MGKTDREFNYVASTQTLIGTKKKELIDTETGESILVDQITKRVYGQKNFWKAYLFDFLCVLGILDSKQVDIFIYIVSNTNASNNIFMGTYDKIAKDCNVSRPTIAKIIKKLIDNGFIKKVQTGAYLVNPNILMKGNDCKRAILLSYYEAEQPIDEISYQRFTLTGRKEAPIESENDSREHLPASDGCISPQ